ncbi:MAG: hypothetical protein ACK5PB_13830 [Pirellula sp.]
MSPVGIPAIVLIKPASNDVCPHLESPISWREMEDDAWGTHNKLARNDSVCVSPDGNTQLCVSPVGKAIGMAQLKACVADGNARLGWG